MNTYIKNKKKSEKLSTFLYILFWMINFIFLEISINMMLKIISSVTSKWYYDAVKIELLQDPFFDQRLELILASMVVVIILIIMFSIGTIILIRNVQLKNMYTQIGVFVVVGYERNQISKMCILDAISDLVLALPISFIISNLVRNKVFESESINILTQLIQNDIFLDVWSSILAITIMIVIVVIHTRVFINKSIKKGINYMLGKGVV